MTTSPTKTKLIVAAKTCESINPLKYMEWDSFIKPNPRLAPIITGFIHDLHVILKKYEEGDSGSSAKSDGELYVSGFSDDQIWQQLDVHNRVASKTLRRAVTSLTSDPSVEQKIGRHIRAHLAPGNQGGPGGDDSEDDCDSGSESAVSSGAEGSDVGNALSPQPAAADTIHATYESQVDDEFFNLSEMEQFLDREDAREMKLGDNTVGDIDMFHDLGANISEDGEDETNASELHAKDFFRVPSKAAHNEKRVTFENNISSEKESESKAPKSDKKSSWDKRQEKLGRQIATLEEELVSSKPWQLTGEVTAHKRPENSLLEEHVDFDRATRLAPVITEDSTLKLEDVIRRRIRDDCWDDVERKVKATERERPPQFKQRLMLDQEKSKKSLHELYEDEYTKQNEGNEETDNDREGDNLAHADIRKMMESLFYKLNALSSYHYTPRMVRTDVKIINNMPSISMEEVAPIHVSDAATLAPEEIKEKVMGDVKGSLEKTKADKTKSRRKKKHVQKLKRLHREKKEKAVKRLSSGKDAYSKGKLGEQLNAKSLNKNVTILKDDKKGIRNNKALKSSKAFFDQLQTDVLTQMKSKKSGVQRKKKKATESGEKFKL